MLSTEQHILFVSIGEAQSLGIDERGLLHTHNRSLVSVHEAQ